MKIRRLYEAKLDWTKDKVINFLKQRDDLYVQDEYIRRRIEEFLIHNKELLPKDLKKYIEDFADDVGAENLFDVYKIKNEGNEIEIKIRWNDGDDIDKIFLNNEQIDDLIEYMNDPDIYKDAKKYNI
jgi:hypothetical protein